MNSYPFLLKWQSLRTVFDQTLKARECGIIQKPQGMLACFAFKKSVILVCTGIIVKTAVQLRSVPTDLTLRLEYSLAVLVILGIFFLASAG
mmetsp:Transcript_22031/g.40189  ORF Transcript_22031/g.40189 Transcript_22031/m.40189 type:complete len:91 (-) Transcript_22031:508-780(-)